MNAKIKNKVEPINRLDLKAKLAIYIPIVLMLLLILLPFVMLVSGSFSDSVIIANEGLGILPKGFTLTAYRIFFLYPGQILDSYLLTIALTLGGMLGSLLLSLPCAYALSRSEFTFRGPITFIFFFTIMFSGGFVPTYIYFRNVLGIFDTIWVLMLPNMMPVGYLFFLRAYFAQLPNSLIESAMCDGASEYRTLWQISIPLIKPGISTVAFYLVLMYWNDASSAMLYADNLVPVAYYLTRMQNYIEMLRHAMEGGGFAGLDLSNMQIPDQTLMYAIAVATTAPMLTIFLFFQKYFVRGLTSGAVKG